MRTMWFMQLVWVTSSISYWTEFEVAWEAHIYHTKNHFYNEIVYVMSVVFTLKAHQYLEVKATPEPERHSQSFMNPDYFNQTQQQQQQQQQTPTQYLNVGGWR